MAAQFVLPSSAGWATRPTAPEVAKVRAMVYTCRPATAAELLHYGSVHEVVPKAELRDAALRLAAEGGDGNADRRERERASHHAVAATRTATVPRGHMAVPVEQLEESCSDGGVTLASYGSSWTEGHANHRTSLQVLPR